MDKLGSIFLVTIFALVLSACNKNLPPAHEGSQTAAPRKDSSITVDTQKSPNGIPITTSQYSLVLPEDWAVLYGPVKERGTTRFQLVNRAKTSTVSITVGPSQSGDAEKMARRIATRLQTQVENKNGQWQCSFTHGKASGYTIVREDPENALLMVLTVSGDIHKADFVFQMRSPYAMLLPQKP